MVPLQHHRNPHQGHQSSDLGPLRAEQGSDETTVRGWVWEIPKIPSHPVIKPRSPALQADSLPSESSNAYNYPNLKL